MTDTTKRSNLESKIFQCFCRDRDTRVLRAVIAAASLTEDPTPAPPDLHTDLQRPILGNRGNTMVRVVDVLVREGVLPGELLMAAWMTLPGVPMAAQTLDDVRAFVADVDATARQAAVARRAAREVHAAVMAHKENEWRIREDRRRMQEREAALEARQDGTYWRERDGRRTAKQSTHVLVDPGAWQAMKEEARRQRTTVGELVGCWIDTVVSDPDQLAEWRDAGLPIRPGKAPLVDMVSRIDVDWEQWSWAKRDAAALGVRVARFVGLVVEDRTEYLAWPARRRRRSGARPRGRQASVPSDGAPDRALVRPGGAPT